jgi:hypothetical protein
MKICLALFVFLLQEPQAARTPEAEAAWQRVLAASHAAVDASGTRPPPIAAFDVRAELRVREGVGRNAAKDASFRYLSPDLVRFTLPSSRRETGRSAAPGERAYWMKDEAEILRLSGREHAEDRALVDRMLAVARNLVALSDPARIRVHALELLAAPPSGLPDELARVAKKLAWLAVTSPDFALTGESVAAAGGAELAYRVELGLDEAHARPIFVVIRAVGDASARAGAPSPLLIELARWSERDGFVIPFVIRVRGIEPHPGAPPRFEVQPSQELGLTVVSFRPALTPADFEPD